MTDEQIKMLRGLIEDQVECALIDGMEHGAWGWAEQQLDKRWKEFQSTFNEQHALNALDKLYEQNNSGMERLANE